MYVCLWVRICIFVPMLLEIRGIESLGLEVIGGCELSDYKYWEPNSGPL